MKKITIELQGKKPLLMHNVRLANPLDEYAIKLAAVSKKRGKTLDDHRALSKLEFVGGLYHSQKIGPYVPSKWLLKAIQEGATKEKMGKTMLSAIFIENEEIKLLYSGPSEIEELYEQQYFDQCCVGVNQSKTVRTRPRFNEWALKFELEYDETLVDPIHVRRALDYAGKVKGIGDYRPRFGTFKLEAFNE